MANKKYTDFPAGTYDTNKIFLQADPVTGALEKVNLPAASSGVRRIGQVLTAESNVAPGPTAIGSIIIPANTLVANGDTLTYFMAFDGVNGTEAKAVTLFFGGLGLLTQTVNITGNGFLLYRILRTASNTLTSFHILQYLTGSTSMGFATRSALDFTIANTLQLTVTCATSAHFNSHFCYCDYTPAS